MIQYALVCENTHQFEAWFRSAVAYDDQIKMGVVSCPICATSKVNKALMAPAVGRKGNSRSLEKNGDQEKSEGASVSLSAGHPEQKKLQQAIRQLREKITSEADYVGNKFASEARKIHDEKAEPRGIYGEATPEEAASLIEDGVEFMPLPALPEEQN
ncbi:MAG: DUF1178 family protein [Devosiaceae bacterium]|nr:DUF1178 family protein [Devosiaceae bacterium]